MDENVPAITYREFQELARSGNRVGGLRKSGRFMRTEIPKRRPVSRIHRVRRVGYVEKGHNPSSDFEIGCQWFCGDPDPVPGGF